MKFGKRLGVYAIGLVILAVGLVLNTKTGWGVSPLVAIAYCVSQITALKFANTTLVAFLIYFVAESLIKGKKNFKAFDLLQIPFCYIFTRCMDLISALLPTPDALWIRILILVLAITCIGFGAAIMLAMRLVPNPADGLVQALSERLRRPMGITKNAFDILSGCAALAIGLLAVHRVVGVGIGTIAAMLGTGRAVALCNRLFGKSMERIRRDAPLAFLGERAADEPELAEQAET